MKPVTVFAVHRSDWDYVYIETIRHQAILARKAAEDLIGEPWADLLKRGWRVRKFKVSALATTST